jgi:predicted signal transduction protein with EAL and GGDEF domain
MADNQSLLEGEIAFTMHVTVIRMIFCLCMGPQPAVMVAQLL